MLKYFFISTMLFILGWNLCYPLFQYILDADAVGYLTIAERYANGDTSRAINGLWSPLNSIILIPFIRNGIDAFATALFLNGLFGWACTLLTLALLKKAKASNSYLLVCSLLVPFVFIFYSYYQVFGDLLSLALLIGYLIIVWDKDYDYSIPRHMFAALLCGIAFYAKAYCLVFFILHQILLITIATMKKGKIHYGAKAAGILLIILCALPYGIAMKNKYGTFRLMGNAGALNMSWYINSGKTFKDDIKILIPPTHLDSPSFWEDPYPSQGKLTTPISSGKSFLKWIARVAFTCVEAVRCSMELSCFVLAIILYGIYHLKNNQDRNLLLLLSAALAITAGYLAMHIESRYIWLLTPITLTIIAILKPKLHYLWHFILCASFLIYPVYMTKELRYKGKENFELAQKLKKLGIINKKITSNETDAGKMWVSAYLSKNYFYTIEHFDYSLEDFFKECKLYGIEYYIYKHARPEEEWNPGTQKFPIFYKDDHVTIYQMNSNS